MLIEFRVKNHRSIREEQVLTMEAMKRLGDADDTRPRKVVGYAEKLLPVAAIYGANASGKSNFLAAIGFMREVVTSSFGWSPDEGIDRDPFGWGVSRSEPSLYEMTMLIEDVRYQYGFVLNDEQILEEWLYAWPKKRKRILFTRDLEKYKFGEDFVGDNEVIARVTRPNALFLSSAPQFNHKQLVGIIRWFSRFEMIRVDLVTENIRGKIAAKNALPLMLDPEGNKDLLSKLGFNTAMIAALKATILKSDVGIHDIRIVEKEILVESKMKLFKNLEFKHDAEDESSWIPLKEESSGTQSLIYLSPIFIRALYYGTTVVVDELESKLHPLLALEIIKAFNDPSTNPRNAQLIFSTHDTNLLGTVSDDTPLRRDQIWLTEKKSKGESVLFPLTEFNARKAENLERGYLQGRYGAVPFLHELLKFEVEQSNEPTGKNS